MPIKVFISHKKEDTEQAGAIAAHLTANGLFVYLDGIDAQLETALLLLQARALATGDERHAGRGS